MNGIYGLIVSVFIFGMSGCNTSRTVSVADVSARTDYQAGGIYTLQKPAFLFKHIKSDPDEIPIVSELGFSGTATNLVEFQEYSKTDSQVAGLLLAGDRIRVVKFIDNKFINIGNFLHVIAVVESGGMTGTTVELSMISKKRRPSYDVFVDLEYLVLEEAEN